MHPLPLGDGGRVDPAPFRVAMSAFATGVTVVTVCGRDGEAYGMTVNAFTSVSLAPPLVLVCLAGAGRGRELVDAAGVFSVNVLAEDQQELSLRFADRRRSRDATVFDDVATGSGATDCPNLAGAAATFDCRVQRIVEAGDHVIVVGEVVALKHRPELAPLVFHAGSYRSVAGEAPADGRARLRAV